MRELVRIIPIFILVLLSGLVGCGSKEAAPVAKSGAEPAANDATEPTNAAKTQDQDSATDESASDPNSADVSGRITLKGEMPAPRKLSITKDTETCGAADTIQDVEGSDGGVANVVIEIKGVEGDDWKYNDPKDGYVLRQKGCQFKPNLVVVPYGKDIQVFNDDPVGHNVNTGDWNQMQPSGPEPIIKPVETKAPTKIGCNIHSWMEAWIYPVQNPYFAVTDRKGNFKIKGVPPGKYRINIWHAALGRKTARLTLEAGIAAKLDHEFEVK